jgi:uncharacterized protein (DUF2236 family)
VSVFVSGVRRPDAEPRPLGPDTLCWDYVGEYRSLLDAGRALLLQVAHPVVAGGVDEHSDFKQRPWNRLQRTIDAVMLFTYGGDDAIEKGRQLRRLHERIRGTDWRGRRYDALDPKAYAWVHATLFETGVVVAERFGRPFSGDEIERFYAEWTEIGRLLAVDLDQLPVDVAGFYAWFERMIDDRLEYNRVVADVIESLSRPPAPPRVPAAVWRPAGASGGHVGRLTTIGTLPPQLRRRWGLAWTRNQERELRALGALVRATAERLPERLRYFPYAAEARRQARSGVHAGARRPLAANA